MKLYSKLRRVPGCMNRHLFHLLFTVLATAPGAPHCHVITCEKNMERMYPNFCVSCLEFAVKMQDSVSLIDSMIYLLLAHFHRGLKCKKKYSLTKVLVVNYE